MSPATVKFCATNCRRKIRFAEKICKIHHGILCFGDICKSCTPSAIISSIDASGVCIQDSPVNEELLMIISGGNVTFDRYGIFKKIKEYTHLLEGGSNIVCESEECGIEYRPKNIIHSIQENLCEVKYIIQPPLNNIYPAPYLNANINEILAGILSSGKLENDLSYKTNISTFTKYYKLNSYGQKEFGGLFCTTPFITIPAFSGGLEHPFLQQLIEEIGNLEIGQSENMEGSDWVYLGVEKI